MLRVRLITVGKLKEKYWREAQAEYVKRLGAFCSPEIIELNESRLTDDPSEKEISAALAKEAADMEKYLSAPHSYNIALCIEGKQLSSEKLSEKLSSIGVEGFSTLHLFIGSSYGLDSGVKKRCQQRLSMSELTFPHQLARIMLLEQIYRGFTIAGGNKYHK